MFVRWHQKSYPPSSLLLPPLPLIPLCLLPVLGAKPVIRIRRMDMISFSLIRVSIHRITNGYLADVCRSSRGYSRRNSQISAGCPDHGFRSLDSIFNRIFPSNLLLNIPEIWSNLFNCNWKYIRTIGKQVWTNDVGLGEMGTTLQMCDGHRRRLWV